MDGMSCEDKIEAVKCFYEVEPGPYKGAFTGCVLFLKEQAGSLENAARLLAEAYPGAFAVRTEAEALGSLETAAQPVMLKLSDKVTAEFGNALAESIGQRWAGIDGLRLAVFADRSAIESRIPAPQFYRLFDLCIPIA